MFGALYESLTGGTFWLIVACLGASITGILYTKVSINHDK